MLSQGIVFPLDILPPDVIEKAAVGDDVTNILGITKWEPYAEPAPEPKKKRSKWITLMYKVPFLRLWLEGLRQIAPSETSGLTSSSRLTKPVCRICRGFLTTAALSIR